MKVELDIEKGCCIVSRELGEKNIPKSGYSGQIETVFLYQVLKELRKQGHDVVKKRMWKDGHMIDDEQNYIRKRGSMDSDDWFCIYNSSYAICDAGEIYNKNGEFILTVHR